MRFLWTYLIVAIVFAFGFVSASMFTVGMPPLRRAPRAVRSSTSSLVHGYEDLVVKGRR